MTRPRQPASKKPVRDLDERVSLHPVDADTALRALLATPPAKKPMNGAGRRKTRKR